GGGGSGAGVGGWCEGRGPALRGGRYWRRFGRVKAALATAVAMKSPAPTLEPMTRNSCQSIHSMSFLLCSYRHLLILRTTKLIHNWIVGRVSRGVGPYIDWSPYPLYAPARRAVLAGPRGFWHNTPAATSTVLVTINQMS